MYVYIAGAKSQASPCYSGVLQESVLRPHQKCEYVANNDLQLQIMMRNCESLCISVAILQKFRITFRFLNPTLYIVLRNIRLLYNRLFYKILLCNILCYIKYNIIHVIYYIM